MSSASRPDPLEALRAAAVELGLELRPGLLERILQIEGDLSEDDTARSRIRAALTLLIETEVDGES